MSQLRTLDTAGERALVGGKGATFAEAMKRGFCRASTGDRVLLSHIDLRTVNGFVYSRIRPVAAPEDATNKEVPCVTGCVGAFTRIQTGDRVRVDGTQGRVTLLGGDAPAATS